MSAASATVRPSKAGDRAWLSMTERGTLLGIRFFFFLCITVGRRLARLALRPLVLYYVLTHRAARVASRQYLERVLPRVTWRDVYRHFLRFAEVTLDWVFLLRGEVSQFGAPRGPGFEHLLALHHRTRGAILLGAHLGSLEAMRILGGAADLRLFIAVHTGNGRRMAAFLERLNPALAGRIIELNPEGVGGFTAVLRVKELIEQGNLVAILGDRVGLNEKNVVVEFLGRPARFPTGAYLLSAMCRCPIYLTFGLYTPDNRYDFFCEPFLTEGLLLPRGDRESALTAAAQRFAARLEHYCRTSPLNWFNFYDFWVSS